MSQSITESGAADDPGPGVGTGVGTAVGTDAGTDSGQARLVEVVVPVHNEEHAVEGSIRRLNGYLTRTFPYAFRITVADNASTDGTWAVVRRLARQLPNVAAVHIDVKGRGRALRQVWAASDADVVGYMDVDLSTDLDAFLPLVAPLLSGHSDLAIGTRLGRGAAVIRGPKRELISRAYNLLLRTTLAARFSDAQCGFKAGRTEIVQALLPAVEDNAWFFDTELLLLAQRNGLRIHEVPVDWVDDPDSRVDVLRTARDDLRGMVRVGRRMISDAFRAPAAIAAGRGGPDRRISSTRTPVGGARIPAGMAWQLPAFAIIGLLSTAAQLVLYLLLREMAASPLVANAISLFVTAIANTAANRRFTFGVVGAAGAFRQQLEGGIAFLIGLALSTGCLTALHFAVPGAGRLVEVGTLVFANGLATLVRFLLLRAWVFHPRRTGRHAQPAPPSAASSTAVSTATAASTATPASATVRRNVP